MKYFFEWLTIDRKRRKAYSGLKFEECSKKDVRSRRLQTALISMSRLLKSGLQLLYKTTKKPLNGLVFNKEKLGYEFGKRITSCFHEV